MFVDASPVKYTNMEAAIGVLRPGGILIVDDLCTDLLDVEAQRNQHDALRRLLLHHPALQAVELAWATDVILATRRWTVG
jgi:predicted O-methyltransferase YrrM